MYYAHIKFAYNKKKTKKHENDNIIGNKKRKKKRKINKPEIERDNMKTRKKENIPL